MAMARMLSEERRRRAEILPQNICTSEKGPSKVSFFMFDVERTLYHWRLRTKSHGSATVGQFEFLFPTCHDKKNSHGRLVIWRPGIVVTPAAFLTKSARDGPRPLHVLVIRYCTLLR